MQQTNQRNDKPLKKGRNPILQPWLICLLFAFWFLYIPAIVGIVLLVFYYIEDRKIMRSYFSYENASLSADSLYKEKISQLENDYKDRKASLEEMYREAEKQQQEKIKRLEQEFASKNQSNSQLEIGYLSNIKKLKEEMALLKNEIFDTQKELKALTSEAISLHYDFSDYDETAPEELKNKLYLLRLEEQSLIKSGEGVIVFSGGSKKDINDNVKQIIRCFNAECNNILTHLKSGKIDSARNKITQSFESLNKIFEVDGIALNMKLLELKLDELVLIYTYNEKTK